MLHSSLELARAYLLEKGHDLTEATSLTELIDDRPDILNPAKLRLSISCILLYLERLKLYINLVLHIDLILHSLR